MMREVLSVEQPCILCEEAMMVTVIYRDDETGAETIGQEEIAPHWCEPLKALMEERVASKYSKRTGPERTP